MVEEEASPNKANAQGRGGEKSRIRCVGSVAPRDASRLTAGARAAVLPLVRRQRENAAARRRRDEAVVGLAVEVAARTARRPRDELRRSRIVGMLKT